MRTLNCMLTLGTLRKKHKIYSGFGYIHSIQLYTYMSTWAKFSVFLIRLWSWIILFQIILYTYFHHFCTLTI